MEAYEKSLAALNELFGKDCCFVLATSNGNCPSQRVVDTYCSEGIFWIVTHALSNKVKDIKVNPNVSLCNNFHIFRGKAYYAGHPLAAENKEIRQKLIHEFEPWYFAHNNEEDENMCYVKIELEEGFFHKDGTGYKVSFTKKEAKEFPFSPQIEMTNVNCGRFVHLPQRP